MVSETTITCGVGHAATCTAPQHTNPHIIGWRVTANTPRGVEIAGAFSRGLGSAGLPTSEPMNRMLPASMTRLATAQPRSYSIQAGGAGGVRIAA